MDSKKPPKQLNAPFVKKGMKYSSKAVAWLYRKSGGRIGGTWRVGAGFKKPVPTLLLEHRGRKSGKQFVSPLVYMKDGDDVIVVASMGGVTKTRSGTTIWSPVPTHTSSSGPTVERCTPFSQARRNGIDCGRSWSRPTPTSTPTRAGPTGRSRYSS